MYLSVLRGKACIYYYAVVDYNFVHETRHVGLQCTRWGQDLTVKCDNGESLIIISITIFCGVFKVNFISSSDRRKLSELGMEMQ